MQGLIVLQPWAGLFASGLKVNAEGETLEFRKRATRVRERAAVYAASTKMPCSGCPLFRECIPDYQILGPMCVPRGVVLAIATLADCRPVTEADRCVPGCPQDFSGFAWVFTDVVALPEPVPCKPKRGAQVWFDVPPEVEAEVLRQAREG